MENKKESFLLCNAGYNAGSILDDGTVNVCFDERIKLGSIYRGFEFRSELTKCSRAFCDCPLWAFEKNLSAIAKGKKPENEPAYDAFFHWHVTYSCNMHCHYCTLFGDDKKRDKREKSAPPKPLDIDRMMKVFDSTGKTFLFSFIGGEPFMVPNMVEACAALTQKHFVCFNTNLTCMDPRLFDVVNIDHLGTLNVSLHILPMEHNGLTQKFIDNVHAMRARGFDRYLFTVVGEPALFPKLDYYREFFGRHGISFKIIPMIDGGGAYKGKPYPESYTPEELDLIERDWHAEYYPLKNTEKNE